MMINNNSDVDYYIGIQRMRQSVAHGTMLGAVA
jgi:hypothetical protein